MMRAMRRPLLAACLLLALAACSSDKSKEEFAPLPTEVTRTTTSAPPVAGSVTSLAAGSSCPAPPRPETASPPPSQGAALADGRYFAFLKSVDVAGRKASVDIAQFLTGEAANKAATEDGEESPPPNDYYIRNASKAVRVVGVASSATLCVGKTAGDVDNDVTDLPGVQAAIESYGYDTGILIWIEVHGGAIVRIDRQFVP